jgi:hypothetical protein
LDSAAVSDPCPTCGGVRRGTVVQGRATLVGVATVTAHASVGFNPIRPWQQKWRDVENGLQVLEGFYARDYAGNEAMRRGVEEFFKSCRELADWLSEHGGKPEAMAYVKSDPDLVLCDGMAQTVKHHTGSHRNGMPTR